MWICGRYSQLFLEDGVTVSTNSIVVLNYKTVCVVGRVVKSRLILHFVTPTCMVTRIGRSSNQSKMEFSTVEESKKKRKELARERMAKKRLDGASRKKENDLARNRMAEKRKDQDYKKKENKKMSVKMAEKRKDSGF